MKRNAIKTSTAMARQFFLYGDGDGKRIVDTTELCKITGTSRPTLSKYLPAWEKEAEEMLRSTTKLGSPNILSLPQETLEKHKEDVDFIRLRLEKTKSELTQLPSIIAELKEFVWSLDDKDAAIQLFDRYLRLSMNEKSLTKHFVDLKRLWDEKVGLDSLKAIQEATGKAVSIAASKNTANEGEAGVVPVENGVFQRRG